LRGSYADDKRRPEKKLRQIAFNIVSEIGVIGGMIINTPSVSKRSNEDDSYIRKSAIRYNIPYLTTLTAALASAKGIEEKIKNSNEKVFSLQEDHSRNAE